jgi:hypothetical protein
MFVLLPVCLFAALAFLRPCLSPPLWLSIGVLCTVAEPLPLAGCRSLGLLFFFLAGGQPQDEHRNWMKFAGAWGWFVAFLAFYDGIAALMKEVYGKVRAGLLRWRSAPCLQALQQAFAVRSASLPH